jgi:DNA-binding response OmpR family regulator
MRRLGLHLPRHGVCLGASSGEAALEAYARVRPDLVLLELGADDYLTRPFGVNELLARVRVALRHAALPSKGAEPIIWR